VRPSTVRSLKAHSAYTFVKCATVTTAQFDGAVRKMAPILANPKTIPAALLVLAMLSSAARASDVDTQFIFGFTQGADVGELGEKEIESQTIGRFGKADGSYAAVTGQLRAEYTPLANLRLEAGVLVDWHGVWGVSGLDDRSVFQFGGFVAEARYRLLNRRSAPVGLTLGIEPHWARFDDISGELASNFGGDLSLAIDKELIENRLFAAVNVLYDPEWSYLFASGTAQQQSTLTVSAAVTAQVEEGIFFGLETHYVRAYDGIGLNAFAGDAWFVGPTTYLRLSKNFAASAAWSIQASGGAVDLPGATNLRDFERNQIRLRFEYTF
jgi:hypothetical protein